MERWMVRVRDYEETVFLYYKNILSKDPCLENSESSDPAAAKSLQSCSTLCKVCKRRLS